MLDNKYATVTEAAAELQLTVQRVRQLIKSGQLHGDRIHDRLIAIPRAALEKFKTVDRPAGYHVDKRPRKPAGRKG